MLGGVRKIFVYVPITCGVFCESQAYLRCQTMIRVSKAQRQEQQVRRRFLQMGREALDDRRDKVIALRSSVAVQLAAVLPIPIWKVDGRAAKKSQSVRVFLSAYGHHVGSLDKAPRGLVPRSERAYGGWPICEQ